MNFLLILSIVGILSVCHIVNGFVYDYSNTINILQNGPNIYMNFYAFLMGGSDYCMKFNSTVATGSTTSFRISFQHESEAGYAHWPADILVALLPTAEYFGGNEAALYYDGTQLGGWPVSYFFNSADSTTCFGEEWDVSISQGFNEICLYNSCSAQDCPDGIIIRGQLEISGFTTSTNVGSDTTHAPCTFSPTLSPTIIPSAIPSSFQPSPSPSSMPSAVPTYNPSTAPSTLPSSFPSPIPSSEPTINPTSPPSENPSSCPSTTPSVIPSSEPSTEPTTVPSEVPSSQPSPAPTVTPTLYPTCEPSTLPSYYPSREPSMQPSNIPSALPSGNPSAVPTFYPSREPTCNPSSMPTKSPSCLPSSLSTMNPSNQPTVPPTSEPTSIPSVFPSAEPTYIPSTFPSCVPSAEITANPTKRPTSIPSLPPSSIPSEIPTKAPTTNPSKYPTCDPTNNPSAIPTEAPSVLPSINPTFSPSEVPSFEPSTLPSNVPTMSPSESPSMQPTRLPSRKPSKQPTFCPTNVPSQSPSEIPTSVPSLEPSGRPSSFPSSNPTVVPSVSPSTLPSNAPSVSPSSDPSREPSISPSVYPTEHPSCVPSAAPTKTPTYDPSAVPTVFPTTYPTVIPTSNPSMKPTAAPTSNPSVFPTSLPSSSPTDFPTSLPTVGPSTSPSADPTSLPSYTPSVSPSAGPSQSPTACPSSNPSWEPSIIPTVSPTSSPTPEPTNFPTSAPSVSPSSVPSMIPSCTPSYMPSSLSTELPTSMPSSLPSMLPTVEPSASPSVEPTPSPSCTPTLSPSSLPTNSPSSTPSYNPSYIPTFIPSTEPSSYPTNSPTLIPSSLKTEIPTSLPSLIPTGTPTCIPSNYPSLIPSYLPSVTPSNEPSKSPTCSPTSSESQLPTLGPTPSPSSYPSSEFSNQPSDNPTIQPTNSPSQIPTQNPTITPSAFPTSAISSAPSAVPTGEITLRPTSLKSSNPTIRLSSRPTPRPSRQPTSKPTSRLITAQPSMAPSSELTSFPTSSPSRLVDLPHMAKISVESVGKSFITLSVSISALRLSTSGSLYCYGSRSSSLNSFDTIKTYGTTIPFVNMLSSITLTLSELRPASLYNIYCGITTTDGFSSSLESILRKKVNATTSCCSDISFANAPTTVYGDLNLYSSADASKYVFSYSLSYPPISSVTISPVISSVTANSSTDVSIAPSSTSFTASSSRLGTFIISASAFSSGRYFISLEITGPDSTLYSPPLPIEVQILPTAFPQSAPTLSSVRFSDNGASVIVLFDKATNQAGLVSNEFSCAKVLSFDGSSTATCLWINSSAIQVNIGPTSYSLLVGSPILVTATNLQAKCLARTECYRNFNATTLSGTIEGPVNPLIPRVFISMPDTISSCSNLSIDAAASTGSGGRSWTTTLWYVTAADTTAAESLQAYLSSKGSSIYNVLSVPAEILSGSNFFNITLTLANFLGYSSSSSKIVKVDGDPHLPVLSVVGSSSLTFIAKDSISIRVTSKVSSCANSSVITYSKYISMNGVKLSYVSQSSDPRVLLLDPYTLVAGTYDVIFQATSPASGSYPSSTAVASASLKVLKGSVVAIISGGSLRQVPLNSTISLDSSRSYDEASASSTLSYSWSCSISTSSSFGSDCSSIFNSSTINSKKVTILPTAMNASYSYAVTVEVTASDFRYGLSTVYIQPYSTPVLTSIVSVSSLYNVDSSISILANLESSEDTSAFWSIYSGDNIVPLTSTTTASDSFTAEETSQKVSFPISFPPYTFVQGSTYSFRLTAYPISNPSLISFSQITIVINAPPTSGSMTVAPSSGTAVVTLFTLRAIGWVTAPANYPMEYIYTYQIASGLPELTISSKSQISFTSSPLPSGISSNEYSILLRVVCSDVFYAANNATSSVIVNSLVTSSKNSSSNSSGILSAYYLDVLSTNVESAFASKNIDIAVQTVNVVASSISNVDCSLVNSSYCASLNREICSEVPNTCGSCLSGFSGISGSFNAVCKNGSTELSSGSCFRDEDCLYGSCISSACVTASKSCPSSTYDTCSGHGHCMYLDSSGSVVDSCLVTNNFCYAKCSCTDGYGGFDCSLNNDNLKVRNDIRASLCAAILNITYVQDSSSQLLDTIVGSIRTAFSPGEVLSDSAKTSCVKALLYATILVRSGYLRSTETSTLSFLIQTLSSFTYSGILSEYDLISSDITGILNDNVISGVMASLIDGQSISLISDYVQLSVQSYRLSKSNFTLSPPLTAADLSYSTPKQSIQFVSTGLSQCNNNDGYGRFAITQYGTNPFGSSYDIINPALQLSSQATTATTSLQSLSLSQRNYPISSETQFYMTFQYAQAQNFNFSFDWLSQSLESYPANTTIPQCTVYDSSSYSFTTCNGCNVSSYSNFNVTFACYDISILCDPTSTNRRLRSSNSVMERRSLQSNVDDTATNSQTIRSGVFGSALRIFKDTISADPFAFSASQNRPAGILVGCLLAVTVLGAFYFTRWDRIDHDYIVYVTKDEKVVKLRDQWDNKGSLYLQREREITEKRKKVAMNDMFSSSITSKSVESWRESTKSFLDVVMQSKYLLNDYSSYFLLKEAVLKRHDYISPFFGPSLRKRRTLRWVRMIYAIIVAIFVDTIFFNVFYPDNGYCEGKISLLSCESRKNMATGMRLCDWSVDESYKEGGYCSLNKPPSSFVFTIILALLTILISLPLMVLNEILLDEVASKRPELDQLGINTSLWFGSSTSTNMDLLKPKKVVASPFSRLKIVEQIETITEYKRNRSEFIKRAKLAYTDLQSVEEEVRLMLGRIFLYLRESYILFMENDRFKIVNRRMTLRAITNVLGINLDGSAVSMTYRQRLLYGNSFTRIFKRIEKSRDQAELLVRNISNFNATENDYKNEFLIQHFILEQLPFFKRYCVKKNFFNFDETSPDSIDPISWLFAWIFILGQMGFFLYYIYNWTAINAGHTLSSWGWNFAIALLQDILFVQIARIYVVYVIGVLAAKRQLVNIYRALMNISMRVTEERLADTDDEEFRVVQYVSGACRASRNRQISQLYSSQVLRLVNDADVDLCREERHTTFGVIAAGILFVPAIVAVSFGDGVSKVVLMTLFHSVLSGFVLANNYLLSVSIYVLILIYIIIAVAFGYKFGVLNPLMRRRLLQRETLKSGKSQRPIQLNAFNRFISQVLDLFSELLAVLSLHILHERDLDVKRFRSQWMAMNGYHSTQISVIGSMSLTEWKNIEPTPSNNDAIPKEIKSLNLVNAAVSKSSIYWYHMVDSFRPTTINLDDSMNDPTIIRKKNIIHENDSLSSLSNVFRDTYVCVDHKEALRRIFLRLNYVRESSCSNTVALLSYIDSMNKMVIYNGYHSVADYCLIMETIWDKFHIRYQPLSIEERHEIEYSFIEWVETKLDGDRGCYFNEFSTWFEGVCYNIDKLKLFQMTSTVFNSNNHLNHMIDINLQSMPYVDISKRHTPINSPRNVRGSWKAIVGIESQPEYDKALITDSDSDAEGLPQRSPARKRRKLVAALSPTQRRNSTFIPFTERQLHNEIRSVINIMAEYDRQSDRKTLSSPTAEFNWIFQYDDYIAILRLFLKSKDLKRYVKSPKLTENLELLLVHWMNLRPRLSSGIYIFDFISWLYRSLSADIKDDFGVLVYDDFDYSYSEDDYQRILSNSELSGYQTIQNINTKYINQPHDSWDLVDEKPFRTEHKDEVLNFMPSINFLDPKGYQNLTKERKIPSNDPKVRRRSQSLLDVNPSSLISMFSSYPISNPKPHEDCANVEQTLQTIIRDEILYQFRKGVLNTSTARTDESFSYHDISLIMRFLFNSKYIKVANTSESNVNKLDAAFSRWLMTQVDDDISREVSLKDAVHWLVEFSQSSNSQYIITIQNKKPNQSQSDEEVTCRQS